MKIFIINFLLSLLLIIAGCTSKKLENFSFQPDYPQPSQEITLRYDPRGTPLEDAEKITLLAYCFPEGMPVVKDVEMTKEKNNWKGSFVTDDTTLAVVVIFKSDELQDDHDKNGYQISLFTQDNKPIKGGLARQAQIAFYGGDYPLRLSRDLEKAKDLFEKEFQQYPEQRQNLKILSGYWAAFYRTQQDSAAPMIKTELNQLAQKESKTVEELTLLFNWYYRINELRLAAKYEQELLVKDPKGSYAEYQRGRQIYAEISIDKKCKLLEAYLRDFPESKMIESLHRHIISAYGKAGQYKQAQEYLDRYVQEPSSNLFNLIAWNMMESEMNLERAVELAKNAVEKARTELKTKEKPSYFTQKEWQTYLNQDLGSTLDTYGFALYKFGKVEKSVPIFEEAVKLTLNKNIDIQERYCRALYESGNIEKAFSKLEVLIQEKPKRESVRTLYKEAYVKLKGSDEGLAALLTKVDRDYREKQKAELKAQMLDKPAPAFTLNDLEGKSVSLKDYRGKIVILDFWAIWCGPCVRSFPAIQLFVNKYQSDENNIKFLFINSWERGDNIDQQVRNFIQRYKYTFHVLRDVENSVVSDYKVEGIPTKFIIDPEGLIRFQSIGYHGDTQLIEELELMIELLR